MRKLMLLAIVLVVVALAVMPAVAYAAHSGSPPDIGNVLTEDEKGPHHEDEVGLALTLAPESGARRQMLVALALITLTMIAGSALMRTSRTTRTPLRDGGWSLSSG